MPLRDGLNQLVCIFSTAFGKTHHYLTLTGCWNPADAGDMIQPPAITIMNLCEHMKKRRSQACKLHPDRFLLRWRGAVTVEGSITILQWPLWAAGKRG